MKNMFSSSKSRASKAFAQPSAEQQRNGRAVPATPHQLQQWFTAIDRDNNGRLDVWELQRALALGNLHFSLQLVAHLIRLYDTNNRGSVQLQEFMKLHSFLTMVQGTFMRFDVDRSGDLDKGEVKQALDAAGFKLEPPAFEAMFTAYDPDRSNTLSMPEYIGMTLFLSSATSAFQAFDVKQAGVITMDYSQFIYAASNCL
mmetsp:Transcript_16617/g.49716  ORF Transcript_16617/g.49716 Transcript_16617/m.49716 type:complete len:200 (-) Transcript_16617:511-1110(-)|eukprot:CAMPEP_0206143174 /NCGR_PEP_ID=MMETSP1473-20131121/19565_1 /ASSEMBLY_ACC=CAM_ASM_001109 /TAXON_ID=1461547 /ORGANISM="Stichococcus sp, Strain RCC1054" /LENGTH=199 /DNA_ID=CAMNT_0053538467 /DNA_START=161 /DNA_END=760 /DNA_ORIENTATION=+